jgi:hypothetical protein
MNNKIVHKIKLNLRSKKEGSILILSLILLSSMIAVVFIFSSTLRSSLKSSKLNQDSIISYYAAESGIEKFLYNILILGDNLPDSEGSLFTGTLNNGLIYSVDCIDASPVRIKSSADYQGVYRSVQLDF